MIKTEKIKSWIERETKRDESFLQWLAETCNVRKNLEQIKTIKDKLKNKKINKTDKINLEGALKRYEEELLPGIFSFMEGTTEEKFKIIKGRQSSRLNRQKTKDKKLITDISSDALDKLLSIKGKHSLKNTIEVMIEYIFQGQTYTPAEDFDKSITTPLLDTIPNIMRAKLGEPLVYVQTLTSNQAKFEALERTALIQRKSIEIIREIVESLQNQLPTKP
ncbi:hypothetical protein IB229_00335 [Pseudomonas sp. PDM14]|uniref:hypothetical protein n=1 Tax=Pseudomonas sp. PDM14 TaxID=2769288 RepID=UPI001781C1D4|nr:hypothetical protein [Pseudomonas sp. PDM14]MBD9481405.1 hypothetical protein [Pseudomonas sp. PDM14]